MNNFDARTQAQVWQRVAEPMPQPREDLRPLLIPAMETVEACRFLTGALTGQSRRQALRLYESAGENLACLRGLCRLSGGMEGKLRPLPMPRQPVEQVLEQCYHRCRQATAEYTSRSAQPEFGVVFHEMARREEAQCARIAQLLGMGESRQ